MPTRRSWTRNEIILAINLYCKIPFGKIHNRNPDIIETARIIGRTPSAVSWKLANFAHIDLSLAREGASNVSRLDGEIWEEFYNNWDDLAFESEQLLKSFGSEKPELEMEEEIVQIPDGREKERLIKSRVNQWFFRKAVLVSYVFSCCITGISHDRLLIASHIIP
jgi:putative restriction endonuclease